MVETGISVLLEEENKERSTSLLDSGFELLMKTVQALHRDFGVTNASNSVVLKALKLIAEYTLPNCAHRRGYVPFDHLHSTLVQYLKGILAYCETESTRTEVQFLPVLMNIATGPAKNGPTFINGSVFVNALLNADWPCPECFPEETILSHLTKLTGSFLWWRLCTYITLTAAISSNASASNNGVKA